MQRRHRDYHPYIDSYIDGVRIRAIPACGDLKQAMDLIELKLNDPDVFIDHKKIDKAVELIERYFEYELLDWELLV